MYFADTQVDRSLRHVGINANHRNLGTQRLSRWNVNAMVMFVYLTGG